MSHWQSFLNRIWSGCAIGQANLVLERSDDGRLEYVCERCTEVIEIPWTTHEIQ